MGHMRIVLLDVERHEFLNVRDGVESVQIQPLMLQNAPLGFDQGIGKIALGLRQDAFQDPGCDHFVHG